MIERRRMTEEQRVILWFRVWRLRDLPRKQIMERLNLRFHVVKRLLGLKLK